MHRICGLADISALFRMNSDQRNGEAWLFLYS